MKTLHVPFGFYPDVVGGTEVYVAALATSLIRRNHPAIVAAPAEATTEYSHGGVPVFRFAVRGLVADVSELYDQGDPDAAEEFARILDRERPDIVHLHAFTRACSVLLVRQAHSRGIPVVFTYHTPAVSCARGTLMLWGTTPCDGMLHVPRCAACALEGRGMPKPIAQLLGRLPANGRMAAAKRRGRAWTALRFPSLIQAQQSATRELFGEVDRIVAFRGWIRTLLTSNGVPEDKIVSSQHALCHPLMPRRRPIRTAGPLLVAFMGRLDPTKGVDILIRAIRMMPGAAILLSVYGAAQGLTGRHEFDRLKRLAEGDVRVSFRTPVDSSAVVETIAAHDVLAVPSQWLETGPLVVLEAFAAGVPVVGSALGGIAELVSDRVNGLLVENYRSASAWATALTRLAGDTALLKTLADHVEPPRGMDDVAAEMIALYETLASTDSRSTPTISSVA